MRGVVRGAPTVDLNRALPAPPLDIEYGVRKASHSEAYSTLESCGSIARSTAPDLSSRCNTRLQDFPPSLERKTPRSGLGEKGSPNAATYTRSGFDGSTRMRAIDMVFSSPTCCHVRPPSAER